FDALVPARLPSHRLFPLVERRIPDPRLGTAAVQQPGDGQPELASIFDLLVELGDGGVVTDDLLAAPATSQTVDRPDHDGVDEGLHPLAFEALRRHQRRDRAETARDVPHPRLPVLLLGMQLEVALIDPAVDAGRHLAFLTGSQGLEEELFELAG